MNNSDWIKVTDRLPDDRVAVLASCPEFENVFALSYHKNENKWYVWAPNADEEYRESDYGPIEAWMPMPKCFVDPTIPRNGDIGIYYDDGWHRVWKCAKPVNYVEVDFNEGLDETLHRTVSGEFYID